MRETMRTIVYEDRHGERFSVPVTFTLVPPGTQNYDGNGHYMDIDIMGDTRRIDVRFSQTTDLKKLARIWLVDYFGNNLQSMQIIK